MPRILVVEDDAVFSTWISQQLQHRFAARVMSVQTCAQARIALRSTTFSLIVLDLLLAGEVGTSLGPDIRPHQPHTPVLIISKLNLDALRMSSYTGIQKLMEEINDLEADAYLQKPFSGEKLAELVGRLLIHRRDRQEEEG